MAKRTSMSARQAIVSAITAGRVRVEKGHEKALKNFEDALAGKKKFDHKLVEVKITSAWGPNKLCDGGFDVAWSTISAGWGSFTFYKRKNGQWICDNEAMSRKFLKTVLCKLADEVEFHP